MTNLSYQKVDKLRAYEFFCKALGNETRLAILYALLKRDMSVSELCNELGYEQSRVSHGLKCLSYCGFVRGRRVGKKMIYSINRDTILPLLKIMDMHIDKYAPHLLSCRYLVR